MSLTIKNVLPISYRTRRVNSGIYFRGERLFNASYGSTAKFLFYTQDKFVHLTRFFFSSESRFMTMILYQVDDIIDIPWESQTVIYNVNRLNSFTSNLRVSRIGGGSTPVNRVPLFNFGGGVIVGLNENIAINEIILAPNQKYYFELINWELGDPKQTVFKLDYFESDY